MLTSTQILDRMKKGERLRWLGNQTPAGKRPLFLGDRQLDRDERYVVVEMAYKGIIEADGDAYIVSVNI